MSICIACNLPEGVIIGVDSASTVFAPNGLINTVYNHAIKVYTFMNKPIGVAFYGMSSLGLEPVGLILKQLETKIGILDNYELSDIVERIRLFFWDKYQTTVQKEIDQIRKTDPKKMIESPVNGIVVAGYSSSNGFSEVWDIQIPKHSQNGSAVKVRQMGNYGENWFATFEPIQRYYKGYDPRLVQDLITGISEMKSISLTDQERNKLNELLQKYDYHVPFHAMPLLVGVKHVSFLLDFAIEHYSYIGAPVVGGQKRIGYVSYDKKSFEIIDNNFISSL